MVRRYAAGLSGNPSTLETHDMTHQYRTTRAFPASMLASVSDRIPGFCRSVQANHLDDHDGPCARVTITAHQSEIGFARRAIRSAKRAASVAHIR